MNERGMERIIAFLRLYKKNIEITADTELLNAGILNSFDIMAVITHLEAEFRVTILGEDIVPENFTNAKTIAEMVARNGGNLQSP